MFALKQAPPPATAEPAAVPCILGVDPGLAHFGWALISIEDRVLLDAGVIITEKRAKKQNVTNTTDNRRRAAEIYEFLSNPQRMRPGGCQQQIVLVASEAESWPRNAGTIAKQGIAFGVLYAVVSQLGAAFLSYDPQEIKLRLCGSKKATKEQIQSAVMRYDGFERLPLVLGVDNVPRGQWEHPADACAAGICAFKSDLIKVRTR